MEETEIYFKTSAQNKTRIRSMNAYAKGTHGPILIAQLHKKAMKLF